MRAWREAGQHMNATPILGRRWTRMCWCGQQTAAGPVADRAEFGLPQFTGSEEGRGPLFDVTGVPFEGHHLPVGTGPQGDKITTPLPVEVPEAVPLMALRIGPRMIVSIPGEMTAQMGRRVRKRGHRRRPRLRRHRRRDLRARERVRRLLHDAAGVRRPALRGRGDRSTDAPARWRSRRSWSTSPVAWSRVARRRSPIRTTPATGSRPTPPRSRSAPRAPPSPNQHAAAGAWRLGSPRFSWRGGVRGFDRPLERAFVQIQRRAANGGWQTVDSDLGLAVLWRVDEDGLYLARWEPRLDQPLGAYRFRITANRYTLTSSPFDLQPNKGLAAAARRGACRQGRGGPRLPAGEGPRGDRRPAARREREPHPPPAPTPPRAR